MFIQIVLRQKPQYILQFCILYSWHESKCSNGKQRNLRVKPVCMIIRHLYYVNPSQNTEIHMSVGRNAAVFDSFYFWSFQEYSVQVTFREQWNDERLRYHDDTQGNTNLKNLPSFLLRIHKKFYFATGKKSAVAVVFCSRDARILFTFDLLLFGILDTVGEV